MRWKRKLMCDDNKFVFEVDGYYVVVNKWRISLISFFNTMLYFVLDVRAIQPGVVTVW